MQLDKHEVHTTQNPPGTFAPKPSKQVITPRNNYPFLRQRRAFRARVCDPGLLRTLGRSATHLLRPARDGRVEKQKLNGSSEATHRADLSSPGKEPERSKTRLFVFFDSVFFYFVRARPKIKGQGRPDMRKLSLVTEAGTGPARTPHPVTPRRATIFDQRTLTSEACAPNS